MLESEKEAERKGQHPLEDIAAEWEPCNPDDQNQCLTFLLPSGVWRASFMEMVASLT